MLEEYSLFGRSFYVLRVSHDPFSTEKTRLQNSRHISAAGPPNFRPGPTAETRRQFWIRVFFIGNGLQPCFPPTNNDKSTLLVINMFYSLFLIVGSGNVSTYTIYTTYGLKNSHFSLKYPEKPAQLSNIQLLLILRPFSFFLQVPFPLDNL